MLGLLGLCVLTGCAQYWARPGGTPQALETAKARCETEAFAGFPQALQTVLVSPAYLAPVRTDCRSTPRGSECVTVGGGIVPPSYSTVDVNAQGRSAAYRSCLMNDGWRLARDKDEAEAITRMTPPSSKTR